MSTALRCAFICLLCLLVLNCGYHTAGKATTIPENVRTIAIPAFINQTHTYRIEQMLTAAVVREMITRTHYHIINQVDADADATLKGTVLATSTTPMIYDSKTGRAASMLVVISMSVTLKDKEGKVLYQNPAYLFREQYEISSDPNSFFEEDTPAYQRLSRDFAQTLVSNILEGF
ncbi:MAG TPA: LptE family protein [Terriglobales bacterium]|jgi:outer membrane lipopolysaccharide assembly protein LptE/RlpB|nr:LptE family protein [Terriglobales bacterium]